MLPRGEKAHGRIDEVVGEAGRTAPLRGGVPPSTKVAVAVWYGANARVVVAVPPSRGRYVKCCRSAAWRAVTLFNVRQRHGVGSICSATAASTNASVAMLSS